MSKVVLSESFKNDIAQLDDAVKQLNTQRIRRIFQELQIMPSEDVFALMLDWDMICVAVRDRQMMIQLNGYCKDVGNLRFVVDAGRVLFEFFPWTGKRNPWRESD